MKRQQDYSVTVWKQDKVGKTFKYKSIVLLSIGGGYKVINLLLTLRITQEVSWQSVFGTVTAGISNNLR